MSLVGKMKRVSESAGLVTTSGTHERNARLLHRISFLVLSYYSAFLCEFDTETFHHFCASAWPAVPLDSVTMRQGDGTRCSSKTRDDTG